VGELSANVRPEFLHHDGKRVIANLRSPYTCGIRQSPIRPWVVAVSGDAGRKRAPEELGIMELLVPRVRARDKNPVYGLAGTVPKRPCAGLVEAWNLAAAVRGKRMDLRSNC